MIVGAQASVGELIAIKLLTLDYVEVTGTFNNPTAALEAAKLSRPDIVILDTELSRNRLPGTLSTLRNTLPDCRIILFSANQFTAKSDASYQSGHIYVVGKHEHIGKFIDIVNMASCARDESEKTELISPTRPQWVQPENANTDATFHQRLTNRELQILKLIASSNTSKEIASKLRISENTVSNHRAHIMSKLSIKDLAALVRYAVRSGIVDANV